MLMGSFTRMIIHFLIFIQLSQIPKRQKVQSKISISQRLTELYQSHINPIITKDGKKSSREGKYVFLKMKFLVLNLASFKFFQKCPPKKSMQIILLLIHHAIHLFICLFIVHQYGMTSVTDSLFFPKHRNNTNTCLTIHVV